MAKKAKATKSNQASELPPPIPDAKQFIRMPNWEEYFDPRLKRRRDFNAEKLAVFVDWNLFQAIYITDLIVKQVKLGLHGVSQKTAHPASLAQWRALLQTAVYTRLVNGGDWFADGGNVLAVARDMGTIAGLLTGSASTEAGPNQLKSAFTASKSHRTCGGTSGGGAWCTFDWF